MTDQPPERVPQPDRAAGKAPAPQDRVEALRAQLAEAEAALPPEPGTIRLRVMPPHDSFTRGAVTVGRDFTPVPAGAVPELTAAADDAGVTLLEA